MLVDVTTKSGFECKVDDDIFNDMEMLECINGTMSDDELEVLNSTVKLAKLMFGEYKKPLYEHIKKEHGKVLPEVVKDDIVSVIDQIGKAKN